VFLMKYALRKNKNVGIEQGCHGCRVRVTEDDDKRSTLLRYMKVINECKAIATIRRNILMCVIRN
jgi:hypothetical protein